MFDGFDPDLFDDPNFKEDSVREVIILPILTRLGYLPAGSQRVVRSKNLEHPFIYVGTRCHPITIIPDYTLLQDDRPVLVLDAKRPSVVVTDTANVQQAYSYAIHPEIRTRHFALCNGRRLVVFDIDSSRPLLDLPFESFEGQWSTIEKYLAPRYLLEPRLRKMAPDFGSKVARLGMSPDTDIVLLGVRLNTFARVTGELFTVTVNGEFAGGDHCFSFDFHANQLPHLLSGLPALMSKALTEALSRAPFQACADLMVEVDLRTHLGAPIQVKHETFVPLIIDEVLGARLNPTPPPHDAADIPEHIFRLSRAFVIRYRSEAESIDVDPHDDPPSPEA